MAKEFAKQFYHSKAWRAARADALRRDSYTCQLCEGRASEVHHVIELTPDNIHDDNIALHIDNLQCLCSPCHKKLTAGVVGDVELQYEFDEQGQVVQRHSPPKKPEK